MGKHAALDAVIAMLPEQVSSAANGGISFPSNAGDGPEGNEGLPGQRTEADLTQAAANVSGTPEILHSDAGFETVGYLQDYPADDGLPDGVTLGDLVRAIVDMSKANDEDTYDDTGYQTECACKEHAAVIAACRARSEEEP